MAHSNLQTRSSHSRERRNSRTPFATTKGFTMIELVVVIILLGILAATALPRFIDIDSEAHDSVVQGVAGGMQTGLALFHAKWVAQGEPSANTDMGDDFSNLRSNASGYPYGTANNSGGTSDVTTSADCLAVYQGVLQAGAPVSSSATSLALVVGSPTDITAVENAPNCNYYYTGENNSSGQSVPLLTYDSTNGNVTRSNVTLP